MNFMKQIAIILVLLMVLFSCESTPKEEVFLDLPPMELDEIDVGFNDNLGQKIEQVNLEVTYIPKKNELSFYLEKLLQKTIFNLNESNREVIRKGIAQYADDFQNKRLNKDTKEKKKNLSSYGEINVDVEWGGLSLSASTETKVLLGYQFVDNSPYFAFSFMQAKNPNYNPDETAPETFTSRTIYMTRDQLDVFYELISSESINEFIRVAKENAQLVEKDTY